MRFGEIMNGKVERKSLRMKYYDYSSNGMYFITICAYDKQHIFGRITDGKMHLSTIGKIAEEEIIFANKRRKDHFIEITKYVIMPNHIHMIIDIYKPDFFRKYKQEDFGKPGKEAVSSVVRSYKSAVTKRVHEISDGINIPYNVWQGRYFDNVIRNEEALEKICNYIETNPLLWKEDKFYK